MINYYLHNYDIVDNRSGFAIDMCRSPAAVFSSEILLPQLRGRFTSTVCPKRCLRNVVYLLAGISNTGNVVKKFPANLERNKFLPKGDEFLLQLCDFK